MILELPLTPDPSQTFSIDIAGSKYRFDVKYNDRAGVWTFDLYLDETDAPILLGVPIVTGVEILEPYNLEIGQLLAVDQSSQALDATSEDLGTRVVLYWMSDDEVPA